MAAEIGNKYAVGNKGGRVEEFDKKEVAIKLLEWAVKDDSINLCKFCHIGLHRPISPQRLSEWSGKCEELAEALLIAKSIIGARREELLNDNKLHQKAYAIQVNVYDSYARDESRDEKRFESELKQKETSEDSKNITVNIIDYSDKKLVQVTPSK